MTEVLVEKVESNYTSNFWQGPCPNWLHLSWPPVWPTPHQTSKCMMVYHVLHVLLNLLFSTGKPRNVFLSVLRQETGFSRKDNSLTQTWVNPCWHCSWVCFDSKLDAAVLIVQWTKIWRGTNRLWTLDSSSYSNVPLTPSADENSTKLGAVHICPPQDKAATAYCLSWTKAQFKRMSENPEEYSTNQTEFLIAHFGWKDEERMICMFSQKKSVTRRKKNGTCVFFLFCFFCCVCLEQRSYEYFLTSGKLRWKRSKGSSAPWLSLSLSRGSLERWLSLFISAQNRKHPSSPHRIQQCLANYPSL